MTNPGPRIALISTSDTDLLSARTRTEAVAVARARGLLS